MCLVNQRILLVSLKNQDTPLHIAAKHGFREIVQLLLSQPQVDVNIKDKDGMIASEVICTKEGDSKLKAAISKLFEGNHVSLEMLALV